MKSLKLFIPSILILWLFTFQTSFLTEQKKFARVRAAFTEKETTIKQTLQKTGLAIDNFHILIVAYKDCDELEIYARKKDEQKFSIIKSYQICSRSGELGPKR